MAIVSCSVQVNMFHPFRVRVFVAGQDVNMKISLYFGGGEGGPTRKGDDFVVHRLPCDRKADLEEYVAGGL